MGGLGMLFVAASLLKLSIISMLWERLFPVLLGLVVLLVPRVKSKAGGLAKHGLAKTFLWLAWICGKLGLLCADAGWLGGATFCEDALYFWMGMFQWAQNLPWGGN